MRRTLTLALLVLGLPACGPERYDRGGETLAKLAELKDRMCGCKDKACADRVELDLTTFAADLAQDHPPGKPGPEMVDKIRSIEQHYGECAAQLTRAPAAGRFMGLFGV